MGKQYNTNKQLMDELERTKLRLIELENAEAECKEVKKALRESEERYALLADNMAGTVWLMDLNLKPLWVSPSVERNRGYTFEELKELPLEKLIAPASLQVAVQSIAEELNPEKLQQKDRDISKTMELEFFRKDGSTFWNEITVKLIRDEKGVPIRLLGVGRDIGRKRIEDALQESERRYSELYKYLRDGSAAVNMEGYITEFNSAMQNMLGYSAQELYSFTCNDITPERWHAIERKILEEQVMKRGYSDIYEKEYRRKDGTLLSVELRTYLIRNDKGIPSGYWAFVRDITERRNAEKALKESSQLLQSIIQGSPIPTFVIGNDHKVIYWNKALEELSGISAAEVIGTNQHWKAFYTEAKPCMADILVHENIDAIALLYAERFIKSPLLDDAYEATEFFPALGRTGKWIRFTAAAIRDSQGNIVGAIETLEDVTERKHIAEALKSERERLASILDGIPVSTFVVDRNGMVVSWNSFNEIYTGVSKEMVLGKPVNLSFLFPEKVSPSLAELILTMGDEELTAKFGGRGLRKSKLQPHTYENTGQIWIQGKERTVNIQAARIVDMNGNIVGVIQTAQDITERIQLESQLRRAERMQAIGTLAGGIAHDFNNILSAVMGYADMALSEHQENDRLRRYLEQIMKAGERARDLVKQIIIFSRQSDEKLRPLRISPIIKEVLKFLRASLPATIQIHQNIQSDQDMVLADPAHIHQLLMNLCTNAAYAMRERKGELKVALTPVKINAGDISINNDLFPGMYLKLTVSDTGCGIDPVIIDRIFDPFFTTKKPGEGTGMGLSVAHGIMKSYGGAITVESEVNKGTVFHVYLPLLADTETGHDAQPAAGISRGKENILFVDDEESLVHLAEAMLTGLGYEFTGKTDSLEALELFHSQPERFNLVITDMTMPNRTGLELAREFMHIRPDIPVILCTGFSEAITSEGARDNGIKDFIMKPMVKNQIAEAIRRVLDHKE